MSSPPEQACWLLADGMWVVIALAAAKLWLHCVYNDRYGYFRDEFDYLACGRHLAWGYVDQPPLVPFLTRLSGAVLGESLRAIRFLPALAISLAVVLTGMIARELGGRSYALLLSAVGVVVAPMYLSDGSLLTTNCLEPLLWTGCVYFAVLAIKRDDPRPWLWFGVIAGLGMEEKYSIAVLGFAIVVGLLLTDERRFLPSKWMWLGGLAALLIWLPNLLWNVKYDFPFLQLMHNIRASGRDVALSPAQYFSQQLLLMQPLAAPVWITGVMALLTWPRLKAFRSLGWSYLVAFAVFAGLKGKNYYLAPIYPMLFAAGAVAIEAGIERWRQGWLKPVYVVALLGAGAWLAPLVVPVLPIAQFVVYMNRLPIKVPRSEHSHMRAALPQHYADQFGWQEIVDEVNVAWQRIPVGERADCGIFAQDYGQAGAIDFLGRKYGLPAALSGHQSYFLWGPRGYSGNCLIVLDDRPEALENKFDQVELVGVSTDNAYALERQIPVFICRGRKFSPLAEVWPGLKKWN
ncbi:MAG TPA: glycosyltransferase family 39 protein [Terriglobales bacterium]|nr:glycosyltransferase family 39 protein [Terriglobales bacterium]